MLFVYILQMKVFTLEKSLIKVSSRKLHPRPVLSEVHLSITRVKIMSSEEFDVQEMDSAELPSPLWPQDTRGNVTSVVRSSYSTLDLETLLQCRMSRTSRIQLLDQLCLKSDTPLD